MRPLPEMEAPKPTTITTRSNHLSPATPTPPLPSTRSSCNPQIHDCRWWPYTNSSDFGANTATIVILLLCALICALALNTAIRCFIRSNSNNNNNNNNNDDDDNSTEPHQNNQTGKPDMDSGLGPPLVAPKVVYTKGLELGDGDCAICLSEFVEGEDIRVMGRCKHGFHVHCIDKWLSTRYSCPTCRGSCLASSYSNPSSSSSSSSSATLEIGSQQNSVPTLERVDPMRVIIYAAPSNICL